MSTASFEINHLQELNVVACHIAKLAQSENFIVFRGEMGAGKTTLIKMIIAEMGSAEIVSSPTFGLVNEYTLNNQMRIFHFDCYRINSEDEMYDIGYEEYFYGGSPVLLEWPEKIPNLLPDQYFEVEILVCNNKRSFTIRDIHKSV